MTMLRCVGGILERVCRRGMEEILDCEQAFPAKGAHPKIRPWPFAAIQRNEHLCAIGRARADNPFALADFSAGSQANCELPLSHDV